MRFKSPSRIVFLDTNAKNKLNFTKKEQLHIILSPTLYWVKKVKLPVKTVHEAKKLLSALFEEMLPKGNYSYTAYKNDEFFYIFAYQDKEIIEELHKNNISFNNIKSIHFAQSELNDHEQAIQINEKQSLYLKDDLLTIIPSSWIESSIDIDLDSIKLSKHTIKLQQFGHIIDKKNLYTIGSFAIAFIILLLVELFIVSSKISAVETSKKELFTKYHLKSTMIQNRSILNKYSKIYEKQKKLRVYISYFLALHLNKMETISTINYSQKLLSVSIKGVSKADKKRLLAEFDQRNMKYKSKSVNNTLEVEVKL